MNIADLINAGFEAGGGLFILNHCRVLYKDKELKGVSIISTVFFSMWGAWNLYYYPSLDQWISFYGGLVITLANMLWVGMMIHYYNKNKTKITL